MGFSVFPLGEKNQCMAGEKIIYKPYQTWLNFKGDQKGNMPQVIPRAFNWEEKDILNRCRLQYDTNMYSVAFLWAHSCE